MTAHELIPVTWDGTGSEDEFTRRVLAQAGDLAGWVRRDTAASGLVLLVPVPAAQVIEQHCGGAAQRAANAVPDPSPAPAPPESPTPRKAASRRKAKEQPS